MQSQQSIKESVPCTKKLENPINSSKNSDIGIKREQMVDYSYVTPANIVDQSPLVLNESVKITETMEKTTSFGDEWSCETKSVDNLKISRNFIHKARLSIEIDDIDLKRE